MIRVACVSGSGIVLFCRFIRRPQSECRRKKQKCICSNSSGLLSCGPCALEGLACDFQPPPRSRRTRPYQRSAHLFSALPSLSSRVDILEQQMADLLRSSRIETPQSNGVSLEYVNSLFFFIFIHLFFLSLSSRVEHLELQVAELIVRISTTSMLDQEPSMGLSPLQFPLSAPLGDVNGPSIHQPLVPPQNYRMGTGKAKLLAQISSTSMLDQEPSMGLCYRMISRYTRKL
jgi:hypothetical protein